MTWGSNPGLLHCRQILYYLSQGSQLYINKIYILRKQSLIDKKEREGEGEREREREKELTQGNQAFVELVCHFIFQGSFYTLTCT